MDHSRIKLTLYRIEQPKQCMALNQLLNLMFI